MLIPTEVPTGVLLMAYGGPESLDDVEPYLLDVRGGRPTPPELLHEVRERYRLIGGRSPLREITERVAHRLQAAIGLPVFVGMRHWHPYIREAVRQMVDETGLQRIVGICMTPHYSEMSVGLYRQRLEEALAETHRAVDLRFVPHWHTQPHYLDGLATSVLEALQRFPPEAHDQVKVIFTAHSLPASILARGDPYDQQLRETARLLAERLALSPERWTFCYQSAPKADIPWLGPPIEEVVVELADAGERNLLIAPIGFLADHVEVLYDIDIAVRQLAQAHGARVERAEMLNDRPPLIAALADLVRVAVQAPMADVRGGSPR
ncbi:MAG: ferrochelatase [Anaerolineae bacterium]|nr:ferrochelatase [Anaerolineae bacterium]MDW8099665.1 ferrochelatase [Anaerolineae bacterium]